MAIQTAVMDFVMLHSKERILILVYHLRYPRVHHQRAGEQLQKEL